MYVAVPAKLLAAGGRRGRLDEASALGKQRREDGADRRVRLDLLPHEPCACVLEQEQDRALVDPVPRPVHPGMAAGRIDLERIERVGEPRILLEQAQGEELADRPE